MSDSKHNDSAVHKPWTTHAAKILSGSESVVLVLIGIALVLVAVLLLYASMYDLSHAVHLPVSR